MHDSRAGINQGTKEKTMTTLAIKRISGGRSQAGFTLIELMVVVAIIAIIGLIAFPAYQDSVRKARRSEAKTTLAAEAAAQEQFFLTYKSYTTGLLSTSGTTENGHYDIAISRPVTTNTRNYLITATPNGDQVNDKCKNFTLTHLGAKGVNGGTITDATECW